MICEMIGVPDDDRHKIFDWSNRLVGFQDEDFRTSEEDGQIAAAEIYAFCEAIAAERRENGRDDIMTALVNAEVDGDRLTPDEINMFFVTLVVAGNETTRNLIAHSLQALLERPEVKADLVANIDDDALWTSATEEFLRWGSSIHNFRRTATRDTEIGGQAIAAGRQGRDLLPVGESRSGPFHRPRRVRSAPRAERAPDVRRRGLALLPRRQPRACADQDHDARVPAPLPERREPPATTAACAPTS